MIPEKKKVKGQSELKWASYFLICSILVSIIYSFLEILFTYDTKLLFVSLMILNILILTYCSFKCIEEIKHHNKLGFFSKILVTVKILIINFLFFSLLTESNVNYIITKRELEIQIATKDESDSNGNFLIDLIKFLKFKGKL